MAYRSSRCRDHPPSQEGNRGLTGTVPNEDGSPSQGALPWFGRLHGAADFFHQRVGNTLLRRRCRAHCQEHLRMDRITISSEEYRDADAYGTCKSGSPSHAGRKRATLPRMLL